MSTSANASPTRSDLDLYAFVALGGVVGAFARHGLDLLIPTAHDGWPTATFIVNLSGAFLLGVIIVVARELAPDPESGNFDRRFRPFLVTGVLGGYTTFSTFMVEADGLARTGNWLTMVSYVLASLVAGVVLVGVGMFAANRIAQRLWPQSEAELAAGVFERSETEDEA